MSRTAPRLAALAAATLTLLLLALPALAADGTTPTPGKHDGVIGSSAGIAYAAAVGIIVGAIAFAFLPARALDTDEH